jgi:hypothetical protein
VESNQTDSLHLESPIVPVAVFGSLTEQIEHSLTELIKDINQATDARGDDRVYHAIALISQSNAIHNCLLMHLERQVQKERYAPGAK